MSLLTVAILTKNEEANIAAVIANAKMVADDILIIDSGSTDKTVELAKEVGARVVYRAWDNDFSAQRNFALDNTDAEWILYLDADERLSDEAIAAVKAVTSQSEKYMCRFIRKNSAFGKDFKYGVLGPDSVVRLFPTDCVKWQDKVHERPVGDLPVKTLSGYIKHYTYRDWNQYISKMNQYSSIGAKNNYLKGKKCGVIKDIVLRPFFAFLKMYLLKLGILEGWLGFVLCVNYAGYTQNKYIKLKLLREGEDNA